MSDVLYPVGGIAGQTVTQIDRVLKDDFEAGNSMTRRLWPAATFKRRFEITHMPLPFLDYQYLAGFFTARGTYDSFWFRDNVNRAGNAKVRFAEPPPKQRGPAVYDLRVVLEETAPLRTLPELNEVIDGAGGPPAVWWDANREIYYEHNRTVYKDSTVWDAALNENRPAWQGGTVLNLAGVLEQWQHFTFANSQWAKTASNVSQFAGTQPACTVFAIARHGTIASKQVLCAVGAMGAGTAAGLAINAANQYEPWLGGAEVWTNAKSLNSAINTWRSVAVTWPATSNTATLYVNAASIGTDANTRNYTAGPAALGAAIDGTLKVTGDLAHVFYFAAALTLAQLKALHNLFAYQYGLATA
jgi:hypothetical protein